MSKESNNELYKLIQKYYPDMSVETIQRISERAYQPNEALKRSIDEGKGELPDKFRRFKYVSKDGGTYRYSLEDLSEGAQKRGFSSTSDEQRHSKIQQSKNPRNMELKKIIAEGLEEMGESNKWLADQAHVARTTIFNYSNGYTFPNPNTLSLILNALKVDISTLEHIRI